MSVGVDLTTYVAGLKLKHPVMNSSGILGSTPEHVERLFKYGVSAVVSKTMTKGFRVGHEPPIIIALEGGGLLNSVGLANPGISGIPPIVRKAKELNIPVIVSVGGSEVQEFIDVASVAEESGADAVELNLSCPHTKGYGIDIGSDPNNVYEVVKAVSSTIKIPVLAKLGLSDNVVKSAGKALEGGAKALTLINTVKSVAIDVFSCKPVFKNVYGGLSGTPIHPIAVRVVYDVYKELKPEIVGVGGVSDWKTAAEMILAGSSAVQIGTAFILKDSRKLVHDIVEGLKEWLIKLGLENICEAIGLAHKA